jgi:hypothetical protein
LSGVERNPSSSPMDGFVATMVCGAARLRATRVGCDSSLADTRGRTAGFRTTGFFAAIDAVGLTLAAGVAPVPDDVAHCAGEPSHKAEAAMRPEQKCLKNVVTKSLDSARFPSVGYGEKTCNIKNLRRLPQVFYRMTSGARHQPCAATRSFLLCSLLSAAR